MNQPQKRPAVTPLPDPIPLLIAVGPVRESTTSLTGSAAEQAKQFRALEDLQLAIGALLGLENRGQGKALKNVLSQAAAARGPTEVRTRVLLAARRHGNKAIPIQTDKTIELLSTYVGAEALSALPTQNPAKRYLLTINHAVHLGNFTARIVLGQTEIVLERLGLADRTHRGVDWHDEGLIVITRVDYRRRVLDAEMADGSPVQLILRTDQEGFDNLVLKGPAHLRFWGRGFQGKKLLKVIRVYAAELISPDRFMTNLRSYEDRDERGSGT